MNKNKNTSLNVSLVCFTVFLVSPRSIEAVCCIQSGSNDSERNSLDVNCPPSGFTPEEFIYARSPAMVCTLDAGDAGTCDCAGLCRVNDNDTGFTIYPSTSYEFLCCDALISMPGGTLTTPGPCPIVPCFATRGDLDMALGDIPLAEGTYGPLKDWCFDAMSFNFLFSSRSFNQDISGWEVSKITTMIGMFQNSNFDQPIGNWNVGQVTNMFGMFNTAASFDQPIGDWNVEKVTNMRSMFLNADAFDQPIGNWNVGQVTTMSFMFNGADAFNQDLCNWGPRMKATPMTTSVSGMFFASDCPNQSSPNVGADPVQPLCKDACT